MRQGIGQIFVIDGVQSDGFQPQHKTGMRAHIYCAATVSDDYKRLLFQLGIIARSPLSSYTIIYNH